MEIVNSKRRDFILTDAEKECIEEFHILIKKIWNEVDDDTIDYEIYDSQSEDLVERLDRIYLDLDDIMGAI